MDNSNMAAMAGSVKLQRIDVTVDDNNVKPGVLEVLNVLRPEWESADIQFKVFTDGISNKIVGCYLGKDNENMILFRVYGKKTELLINRQEEIETFQILFKVGCGPELYAAFNNGLCYEYVPGVILSTTSVKDEQVYKLITKEMALIHAIQPSNGKIPEASVFKTINKWLDTLPTQFEDAIKQEKFLKEAPDHNKLRSELAILESALTKLNSPVVFCHNDLLLGNVIYSESKGKVCFIDYEYASYNHQAFDLGNHFAEMAGLDVVDYSLYPDKAFQFKWLREYLVAWHDVQNNNEPVTEREIETLYIKVNKFTLASHFFWGLWGLIQAHISVIDFDYLGYAIIRFNEYFNKKEEFLSMQFPK